MDRSINFLPFPHHTALLSLTRFLPFSFHHPPQIQPHTLRYPTKRKLAMVLEAARRVCALSHSGPSLPPPAVKAWCTATVAALEGAEGAGLAPLGEVEHRRLGQDVARAYLMPAAASHASSSSAVSLRAHVTSKARTRDSCRAFRDGAAALWPPARSSLACDEEGARSEGLLRPYAACARLQAHRVAVVGEEEERGGLEDGCVRGGGEEGGCVICM